MKRDLERASGPAYGPWNASDTRTQEVLQTYFHVARHFEYSIDELAHIEECARSLGAVSQNVARLLREVGIAARLAVWDFLMLRDFSMEEARSRQSRLSSITKKALSLLEDLRELDLGDDYRIKINSWQTNGQILLDEPKSQRMQDYLLMISAAAEKEAEAIVERQKKNKKGNLERLDVFLFSALTALAGAGATNIGISESGPSARFLKAVYNPFRQRLLALPDAPLERLTSLEGATIKGLVTRWHRRQKNSKSIREISP